MDELNVKVGDKVLMSGGYTHNRYERICAVSKVTPTGRIRLEGIETQFDKFGQEMCGERWGAPCSIKLITEKEEKEIREKWRKKFVIRKAIDTCRSVKLEDISYEKALKIIEIFGEKENERSE